MRPGVQGSTVRGQAKHCQESGLGSREGQTSSHKLLLHTADATTTTTTATICSCQHVLPLCYSVYCMCYRCATACTACATAVLQPVLHVLQPVLHFTAVLQPVLQSVYAPHIILTPLPVQDVVDLPPGRTVRVVQPLPRPPAGHAVGPGLPPAVRLLVDVVACRWGGRQL